MTEIVSDSYNTNWLAVLHDTDADNLINLI